MIVTILIYLISFILGIVAGFCNIIASGWTVWPNVVLTGLTYFFKLLMNWDFLLATVALLKAVKFLVGFLIIYFGVKLFLKLMNYFRGSGSIDV